MVREQLPDVAVLAEPLGRNTAAAIALAALAIDRSPDDVMVVLPGRPDDRARDVPSATCCAPPAEHLATGAFGIDDPLVTLGVRADRPATEYGYLLPDADRGEDIAGLRAYPLRAFEEKPDARASRTAPAARPGSPGTRACSCGGAGPSARPSSATPGSSRRSGRWSPRRSMLERAYESIQKAMSIDYAVMEGAARDGRVVMATMDVGWSDLGSWTALLGALGARGERRGRAGRARPSRSMPTTWSFAGSAVASGSSPRWSAVA